VDNLQEDLALTRLELAAQKRDEAEDILTMAFDLLKREVEKCQTNRMLSSSESVKIPLPFSRKRLAIGTVSLVHLNK
jgi:hypothetical protein